MLLYVWREDKRREKSRRDRPSAALLLNRIVKLSVKQALLSSVPGQGYLALAFQALAFQALAAVQPQQPCAPPQHLGTMRNMR